MMMMRRIIWNLGHARCLRSMPHVDEDNDAEDDDDDDDDGVQQPYLRSPEQS